MTHEVEYLKIYSLLHKIYTLVTTVAMQRMLVKVFYWCWPRFAYHHVVHVHNFYHALSSSYVSSSYIKCMMFHHSHIYHLSTSNDCFIILKCIIIMHQVTILLFRFQRQTWSSWQLLSMTNSKNWRNRRQYLTESWPTQVKTTTNRPTSSSHLSMHM